MLAVRTLPTVDCVVTAHTLPTGNPLHRSINVAFSFKNTVTWLDHDEKCRISLHGNKLMSYLPETYHWMFFCLWCCRNVKRETKVPSQTDNNLMWRFFLKRHNWTKTHPSRWDSRASSSVCHTMYLWRRYHTWHKPCRENQQCSVQMFLSRHVW